MERSQIADVLTEMLTTVNGDQVIADVFNAMGYDLRAIANAITPSDASQGYDATGGVVTSLTEACMGMTAALCRVASALSDIAEAIREKE